MPRRNANKRIASEHAEEDSPPRGHGAQKFGYLRAIETAPTTRVEALADGIFAVAMTLLILDVRLPPLPQDLSAAQYASALFNLWPKLIVFVTSFISLGRIWQMHRNFFHLIKRCDQQLLFWNLLILMFVCFMPFVTSLAGERPYYSLSAALYVGDMLMLTLCYRGLWHHASYGDRLLTHALDPDIRKSFKRMFDVFLVLVLAALALSYINSILSIGLIVVHQLLMFFGPPIFKGREA